MSNSNDVAKASRRKQLRAQIKANNDDLKSFNTSKNALEKKIRKCETAITNIGAGKETFGSSKKSLESTKIEESFWAGEKANEAKVEYSSLKTSISTIDADVIDTIDTIEMKKKELENKLETVKTDIGNVTATIADLTYQLNQL